MKLNNSFKIFKKLHRKKINQIIFTSEDCKNYKFVEIICLKRFLKVFNENLYSLSNIRTAVWWS